MAIRECLYRRRAGRSVQNGQFTKKITLAIKREIAFLSVDSGEGSRSSFLKYVEGPGVVSLPNDQIAFFDCDRLQPVDHAAQHGCREPAEIAELIKETLQGTVAAGRLDVLPQLGHAADELQKVFAIDPQNVYGRTAAHYRVSGSTLRQCGFPERVAWVQHSKWNFLAIRFDL